MLNWNRLRSLCVIRPAYHHQKEGRERKTERLFRKCSQLTRSDCCGSFSVWLVIAVSVPLQPPSFNLCSHVMTHKCSEKVSNPQIVQMQSGIRTQHGKPVVTTHHRVANNGPKGWYYSIIIILTIHQVCAQGLFLREPLSIIVWKWETGCFFPLEYVMKIIVDVGLQCYYSKKKSDLVLKVTIKHISWVEEVRYYAA